jgi:hypothetical protein
MSRQLIMPKADAERRMLDVSRVTKALSQLGIDTAWCIEIEVHKPTRSSAQNRYLWGCVYPTILKAGQLQGWEPEELHDYCLGEHFGWETIVGFGRKKVRPIRRSARLNKQDFADFIAFIQRRMALHGIIVPDPDPDWQFNDEAGAEVASEWQR